MKLINNFFIILCVLLFTKMVHSFDLGGISLPDLEMPELEIPEMPELEMPELEMPELEMPEMEMPEFEMPEMPSFDMPSFDDSLPDVAEMASESIPDVTNMPAEGAKTLTDVSKSLLSSQAVEVQAAIDICKNKVQIETDEAIRLITQDTSETSEGECLLACVKKQTGLITSDNKYNMTTVDKLLSPLQKTSPEVYNQMVQVYKDCAETGTQATDECVAVKELTKCVNQKRDELRG